MTKHVGKHTGGSHHVSGAGQLIRSAQTAVQTARRAKRLIDALNRGGDKPPTPRKRSPRRRTSTRRSRKDNQNLKEDLAGQSTKVESFKIVKPLAKSLKTIMKGQRPQKFIEYNNDAVLVEAGTREDVNYFTLDLAALKRMCYQVINNNTTTTLPTDKKEWYDNIVLKESKVTTLFTNLGTTACELWVCDVEKKFPMANDTTAAEAVGLNQEGFGSDELSYRYWNINPRKVQKFTDQYRIKNSQHYMLPAGESVRYVSTRIFNKKLDINKLNAYTAPDETKAFFPGCQHSIAMMTQGAELELIPAEVGPPAVRERCTTVAHKVGYLYEAEYTWKYAQTPVRSKRTNLYQSAPGVDIPIGVLGGIINQATHKPDTEHDANDDPMS